MKGRNDMEQILKLKEESEAFQTEFEVLAPSTLPADIEAQYLAGRFGSAISNLSGAD